jgi:hypothetical protein
VVCKCRHVNWNRWPLQGRAVGRGDRPDAWQGSS